MAMGVPVDDTVHFVTWYRRAIDAGNDRRDATLAAYHACSRAMFQTTLIGGLGLLVFALSDFLPTRRFGYLMFAFLSAALVGDLVVLPAILSGPAGRLFVRRNTQAAKPGKLPPVSTSD